MVQVNGKVRAKFQAPVNLDEESLKARVMSDSAVKKYLDGKKITRIVIVKNKLISIVIA